MILITVAYGQTGSGKTHTMIGPDSCIKESFEAPAQTQNSKWHKKPLRNNQRGVIPRTLEQILSQVDELKATGWTYTLQASFLEIYNETVQLTQLALDTLFLPRPFLLTTLAAR
jgi:kinesin family protein C1